MKKAQNHATVSSAFGQELDNPIKFTYEYEEFETFDEIPADVVKALTDQKRILTVANQRQSQNARAAKTNELLEAADIRKPDLATDRQAQVKHLMKGLMASGKYTEEQAREFAEAAV